MNPKQKSLQRLLDDVVVSEAGCEHLGPTRSALLEIVSQERTRRKHTRLALGTAVGASVCALVALLFLQRHDLPQRPSSPPQIVQTTPPPSDSLTIHEIDDKELLELLKGTPVALMEWPDGKRTLLVMER